MTETRTITLGGETFDVPPLPLRINKRVYPMCRDLSNDGITDRAIAADGRFTLDISEEEVEKLTEIAFLSVSVLAPDLTRDAFENLPINPGELYVAFLMIRYQTGIWVEPVPAATEDGEAAAGEAEGAA